MAEKKNIRRKTLWMREKARRFSLILHVCLPCICSFYNKTFNSYRNSKNLSPKVSRSFRLYRDICTPVSEDIRAHDDKNRTWKALVFKVCTVNITKWVYRCFNAVNVGWPRKYSRDCRLIKYETDCYLETFQRPSEKLILILLQLWLWNLFSTKKGRRMDKECWRECRWANEFFFLFSFGFFWKIFQWRL